MEMLLLSVLCLSVWISVCSATEKSETVVDLPGHLKPLGSHMEPKLVARINHMPTPQEFHEQYVGKKAVVFEGLMKNQQVIKNWQDDEYLRYTAWNQTLIQWLCSHIILFNHLLICQGPLWWRSNGNGTEKEREQISLRFLYTHEGILGCKSVTQLGVSWCKFMSCNI